MNAKVHCGKLGTEQLDAALSLGGYVEKAPGILSIAYSVYSLDNQLLVVFDGNYDFSHLLFIIIDIQLTASDPDISIKGYVDTNADNKITAHLKGDRVCIYTTIQQRKVLKMFPDKDLTILNYVTTENKNYLIDSYDLSSSTSEDAFKYDESLHDTTLYKHLKDGIFLYEDTNFEAEFLEDN